MSLQTELKDIIVTTPKKQMQTAALEAEQCKRDGGGFYFRSLGRNTPKHIAKGSRCFYVEDGFIRGFADVVDIVSSDSGKTCATTGRVFPAGNFLIMDAETWQWIYPIPKQGFQGWRYFDAKDIAILGDWLDDKPNFGY